jgi:hypothetical protein
MKFGHSGEKCDDRRQVTGKLDGNCLHPHVRGYREHTSGYHILGTHLHAIKILHLKTETS